LSTEKAQNREQKRTTRVRQQLIGRELRRIFDAVVHEPVPDEFMNLLKMIDAATEISLQTELN
jgi:phosphoribosylpyrophosphate synthetase